MNRLLIISLILILSTTVSYLILKLILKKSIMLKVSFMVVLGLFHKKIRRKTENRKPKRAAIFGLRSSVLKPFMIFSNFLTLTLLNRYLFLRKSPVIIKTCF